MSDIKILTNNEKEKKKREKRRVYMREYYRRKKAGKIPDKKKAKVPHFTIKRGEFIVVFT